VIDKDGASALLACQLRADWLVMLTDVDALYLDWGTEMARAVRHVTARATREFAPGSMRPKVLAACGFVNKTGKRAGIGALRDASAIIGDAAGTIISADPGQLDDPGWQHGRMMTHLQPRR
jgi:carbamate kinase